MRSTRDPSPPPNYFLGTATRVRAPGARAPGSESNSTVRPPVQNSALALAQSTMKPLPRAMSVRPAAASERSGHRIAANSIPRARQPVPSARGINASAASHTSMRALAATSVRSLAPSSSASNRNAVGVRMVASEASKTAWTNQLPAEQRGTRRRIANEIPATSPQVATTVYASTSTAPRAPTTVVASAAPQAPTTVLASAAAPATAPPVVVASVMAPASAPASAIAVVAAAPQQAVPVTASGPTSIPHPAPALAPAPALISAQGGATPMAHAESFQRQAASRVTAVPPGPQPLGLTATAAPARTGCTSHRDVSRLSSISTETASAAATNLEGAPPFRPQRSPPRTQQQPPPSVAAYDPRNPHDRYQRCYHNTQAGNRLTLNAQQGSIRNASLIDKEPSRSSMLSADGLPVSPSHVSRVMSRSSAMGRQILSSQASSLRSGSSLSSMLRGSMNLETIREHSPSRVRPVTSPSMSDPSPSRVRPMTPPAMNEPGSCSVLNDAWSVRSRSQAQNSRPMDQASKCDESKPPDRPVEASESQCQVGTAAAPSSDLGVSSGPSSPSLTKGLSRPRGDYETLVQQHASRETPEDPALRRENAKLKSELDELRAMLAKRQSTAASYNAGTTHRKSLLSVQTPPEMHDSDASSIPSSPRAGPASPPASTVVKPTPLSSVSTTMRLHDLEVHRRLLAARIIQSAYRDWSYRKRVKRRMNQKGITRVDQELASGYAMRQRRPAGGKSMAQIAIAATKAARAAPAPKPTAPKTPAPAPAGAPPKPDGERSAPKASSKGPSRMIRYAMPATAFTHNKARENDMNNSKLERLIGSPSTVLFNAMEREHASEVIFSSHSVEDTSPKEEWLYVLTETVGSRPDRVHDCTPDRVGWRLEDFAACDTARRAGLIREEVLAVRLYTGPMSEWYNATLRSKRRDEFTTTIHTMNSAVVKLSKLQKAMTVYRIMTITAPPKTFFAPDPSGSSCGLELGFMSTTSIRTVAMRFAEARLGTRRRSAAQDAQGSDATQTALLRIRVIPTDQAADVSFASQVPAESELVFAPLTTLEVISYCFDDESNLVVDVRPRRSHPAKTVDQTIGKMKCSHIELLDMMIDELRAAGAPELSLLPLTHLRTERLAGEDTTQYNLADKYVDYTASALKVQERVLQYLAEDAAWEKVGGKDKDIANRMMGVVAVQSRAGEFDAAIGLTKAAFRRSALPPELSSQVDEAEKFAVGVTTKQAASVIKPSDIKKLFPPAMHSLLEAAVYFFSLGVVPPWPPLMAALLGKMTPAAHMAFGETVRLAIARQGGAASANVLVWNERTGRWNQGISNPKKGLVRVGSKTLELRNVYRMLMPVDAGIGALLNAAASNGDVAMVNTLLAAKADYCYCDERANSTLHLAVMGGHAEVCQRLVQAKADVMAPNMDGQTAWDLALRGKSCNVRRVFNPCCADLDVEGGVTPAATVGNHMHMRDHVRDMFQAAMKADEQAVKEALQKGPRDMNRNTSSGIAELGRSSIIDAPNLAGVTALMFASRAANGESTVRYLLKMRASPHKVTRRNCGPLMMASACGNVETVELLLEMGAMVDDPDQRGYTPLHMAVENNHPETAKALILAGADVNSRRANGWTCMQTAAYSGTAEVLQALLNKSADVNEVVSSGGGFASIHLAAYNGFDSTLLELGRLGADVDAEMDNGWSPLMIAAAQGHAKAVEALLVSHADIDFQGSVDGYSALIAAASNPYDPACVGLLLQAKASVHSREAHGVDALMMASRMGHTQTIQQLLRQRANAKYARPGGTTALMDAAAIGAHAAVKLLLGAAADIAAADENGLSALHHAAKGGHEETIVALLAAGADVAKVDTASRSALSHAATKSTSRRLLEAGADANHLPEAFCADLGLPVPPPTLGSEGLKTPATAKKRSGMTVSDGVPVTLPKAAPTSTHSRVVSTSIPSKSPSNGLKNAPGPHAKASTANDKKDSRASRDLPAVAAKNGRTPPDFFAVAPPDFSGRPGEQQAKANPVMAGDPVGNVVGEALAVFKFEPSVTELSPILSLSEESISPAIREAICLIQKCFRSLRRREKREAKQAFYKPRGSKGMKFLNLTMYATRGSMNHAL